MKLFYICHTFHPSNNGYANAFKGFVSAAKNSPKITGLKVFVTGYERTCSMDFEGVEVSYFKPSTRLPFCDFFINNFIYAKKIRSFFEKENPDVVVVETFDQAFFIAMLGSSLLKKTIIRIHATSETEYTFFGDKLKYKVRKYLIKYLCKAGLPHVSSTNSFHVEFAKKYFYDENVLRISDTNFSVMPNTIYEMPHAPEICEQGQSYVHSKLQMLMLGRMDKLGVNQKGFLDLSLALRYLCKEELSKFELSIVGDGANFDEVKNYFKDYPNVTFIRSLTRSEMIEKLKEVDAVVLPSRYEGMSMFALEALAFGCVCLFSRTGGLVDMIKNNGYFFEPHNPYDLARALSLFFNSTEDEIAEMKNYSVIHYNEAFSKAAITKAIDDVYL